MLFPSSRMSSSPSYPCFPPQLPAGGSTVHTLRGRASTAVKLNFTSRGFTRNYWCLRSFTWGCRHSFICQNTTLPPMVPLFLALGFFRPRIASLCYCHFCFSFETRLLSVGWSPSGFILPYEVFCFICK